ncbi:alpha/beta hydrolase [Roseovarius sp. LXJ103]|uniref:alpha/beta fold hydrolase n=1 Tax=Roseovarius carneus TaxID=2853164 RepID=UPI000D60E0F0|nr:alpha/beta hydrolase [Roseovarius carneus]MBZ8118375.1 alpha/beta hydrolase [Roseovarius carneus]PWE37289.1 alpha/beta hydrolase [Pelagicola sp. LXJ1103]
MIWPLAFVAAAALAPFARETLRPGPRLKDAPGKFATLSQGQTHYQWLGASKGPVAVCVHGLSTPSFVWGPVARALGEMGFRVLVYDLYGRGYSSAPRGLQDSAFFTRQLGDLLDHEGITHDITLLGYSMGGMIAPAYAAENMRKIRQMVLIAPAGLGHDLGPAGRLMAQTGLLGSWAMHAVYGRSLRRALEAERDQPSTVQNITDLQLAQLRRRGFRGAVLSSLRGILDEQFEDRHCAIAAHGLPLLALWGAQDPIIPLSGQDKLTEWNPSAQHRVVPDAGHNLPFANTDAVTSALNEFLIR